MADMMKAMGGAAKRGPLAQLGQMFGIGGGMPQPTPEQLEAFQKQMGGARPAPAGGMPDAPPPGLSIRRRSCPGLARRGCPALAPQLPGLGGGAQSDESLRGKEKVKPSSSPAAPASFSCQRGRRGAQSPSAARR